MKRLKQLNIRQRYHLIVLVTLAFAGSLLLASLNLVIKNYANGYTSRYWQDHTAIFAESAQFAVLMGAKSRTDAVVNAFAHDKNILKAAIYNQQHETLAETGKSNQCTRNQNAFAKTFFLETENQWCFYAPIIQDQPEGRLEQQLAIEQKTKFLGYVELIVAKTEMNALLQRIMLISGIVVVTFLAVVFIVLRRSSGAFTLPIMEIINVMKQVANGQSGARVAFSSNREIVDMGESFNEVLSRIEANEKVMEQTIAERTQDLTVALEASQAANRYKSQIVATVSHEMKSPLHVIQNCLATSLAAFSDKPENALMRESYQRALQRTTELNDLINNILLHGKLEADSIDVKLQPLEVLPLMQACADRLEPFLNRQRNTLKLLGARCSIMTEAEFLTHIVNNLLHNACKFTTGGQITLDWQFENDQFEIIVSDTGCGIPEEFQDKIFESFWQVDMSMSRKFGGTGLGLTVTKQFVELLGGKILVESTDGKGCVFTVKFPNRFMQS